MKDDIVIVGAARTPVGAFNGAFATLPAHELGKVAIKAALERAGVEPARRVRGDPGPDPAPPARARTRPARPRSTPASRSRARPGASTSSAARGCARSRSAIRRIVNGDSEIVVAGGQESMSMAPHCAHLRSGVKMGDFEMVDTMIKDGLWDAFNGYHMGNTAENVARQWQITRAAAGRVRGRLAEQGRGGAEGRQVQGRDRRR